MKVKPNMIINNYFHGEFSQTEAADSWKRERGGGGAIYRPLIIWMKKSFDPDRIWDIFPPVLVKNDSCCFPFFVFWEWCQSKLKGTTTKVNPTTPLAEFPLHGPLTHWLFHLMKNPTRSNRFLPQQNNNFPLVESVSLSCP